MYKVDYHMHSHFSDGILSPTDLVKRAKEKELQEIAITDHDVIDGVLEAQIAGKALDISVIAGIEVEARYSEKTILHILGYRFDPQNKKLKEMVEKLSEFRNERNEKLLKGLAQMGYPLTRDEIITYPDQEYICKLVIARAMVRKGYIQKTRDAFSEGGIFLDERVRSILKENISANEAISVLKEAGATCVWAHPMKTRGIGKRGSEEFYENVEEIILNLKKIGLKGMECYHTDHSEEESLELVKLAEKYHLHITQGSDYHGEE